MQVIHSVSNSARPMGGMKRDGDGFRVLAAGLAVSGLVMGVAALVVALSEEGGVRTVSLSLFALCGAGFALFTLRFALRLFQGTDDSQSNSGAQRQPDEPASGDNETPLMRKLLALRSQIVTSGAPLLDADQINDEVHATRGGNR